VEDADAGDVVAGAHLAGDVVDDVDVDVLRRLAAAAEPLGRLLNAELLGVDELRLVEVDAEGPLSLTALTLVGLLEPAVALGMYVIVPQRWHSKAAGYLRANVGRLTDDALDRDELADVIVVDANSSDVDALGEVFDPDVRAPEADVCGEIVEPQRLLGVLAHLLRLRAEVLGEVAVELVEVVVLDVQRSLFVGGRCARPPISSR